jgi:hypothetical protein
MNFKWSKSTENKFKRKSRAIYWQFPLALAVLGGGSYYAWQKWGPKKDAVAVDFLPTYPEHQTP